MQGARGAVVGGAVVGLAILASAACAGGPVLEGGAYRDAKLGWTIAAPPAEWTRIRVEGADLALRGPGGELMSLTVHCGVPLAAPATLARHLRLGVPDSQVRDAAEVSVDGRPGWTQVFDAHRDGKTVRIATVTRVDERCVQDFALASQGERPAAEVAFDAWWKSFRAAPSRAGGAR
jgi:hypothetical protein